MKFKRNWIKKTQKKRLIAINYVNKQDQKKKGQRFTITHRKTYNCKTNWIYLDSNVGIWWRTVGIANYWKNERVSVWMKTASFLRANDSQHFRGAQHSPLRTKYHVKKKKRKKVREKRRTEIRCIVIGIFLHFLLFFFLIF